MDKIGKFFSLMADIVRNRVAVNQFIKFRNSGRHAFSGSVLPEELPFLKELVELSAQYNGPIVEIGTLYGFTTQHIAEYKRPDQELITVDNFSWNPIGLAEEAHRDFCLRSLYYLRQCAKTTVYDGSGTSFYSSYDGETPAMVFIDADHSYEGVKEDIDWAVSRGVPIICGHDYSDAFAGVKKAVNESFPDDYRVEGTLWAYVAD
jgi:predicted O-methyltransferase YrrM